MNTLKRISLVLIMVLFIPLLSCLDLGELNKDPNNPENVSSNYILTYLLVDIGKTFTDMGFYDSREITGLLQYMQCGTNESAWEVNLYDWSKGSWSSYYNYLRNINIIYVNAQTDGNKFFEAVALTLRSQIFGLIADLFGDAPYTESLKAAEELYFPKYDPQKDIYKGVLEDLKKADEIFSSPDISKYGISASADVLYGGNATKWLKLVNSLRLRYSMRVYDKKSEMSALGIDIVSEFNDAAPKAFTGNSDDAIIAYIGTNADNAAPGGPLTYKKPGYNQKPAATIVNKLKSLNDPRLYRWVNPVLIKWDRNITVSTDKKITNMFGDSWTVTYRPTTRTDVDTSLYVGMPVGMEIINLVTYNYGENTTVYESEKNPFVSYIHDRYRTDKETYRRIEIMMYPEVEFLLAEAALKGGFSVSGTAEDHYKKGIQASLSRWGITDGKNGFSFNNYYNNSDVSYSAAINKLERIMEQKWIAGWLTIEPWFDWRRTGYPALKAGPAAMYSAGIPLRFAYPNPNQDEKYLVNYNAAIERLEPTVYVPAGQSKDHVMSKIWVIQGTGKPF